LNSVSPALQALADELELGPAAPVLHTLSVLYREVDLEVERQSVGLELPCRAGCDACCRESVFLSAPEFLLVASHLAASWSKSELTALLDQMSALADRFADELELLESILPGAERDEVAARVKFDCPFLSDSRCRIYSVRELNARTFGSSWDATRHEAYGCELTHARLRVLGPEVGPKLAGAREMRARLTNTLPNTARVHVYPWWFTRYRALVERLAA
jgi:Fe-S-cluster containining protein